MNLLQASPRNERCDARYQERRSCDDQSRDPLVNNFHKPEHRAHHQEQECEVGEYNGRGAPYGCHDSTLNLLAHFGLRKVNFTLDNSSDVSGDR